MVSSSLEIQKRLKQTEEKKRITNLQKYSNCEKRFLISMLLVQLTSINAFLFHGITGRLFFIKVCCYPEVLFNCHVLAFFKTNDSKEV